jgi:hypothetical protein
MVAEDEDQLGSANAGGIEHFTLTHMQDDGGDQDLGEERKSMHG